MNMAQLLFHIDQKENCPAWVFCGSGWTDEKKAKVNTLLKSHMNYEQFPGFNYWQIFTMNKTDRFTAMRFTWDSGCLGGSWEKFESDFNEHYGRF